LSVDEIGSSTFWRAYLHAIAYREGIGDLLAEGEERFFIGLMELIPEDQRERAKVIGDHWLYKAGSGFCGQWGGGKVTTALSVLQQAGEIRPNMQSRTPFLNPNTKACYLAPEDMEKTARAGALKYFGTEKVRDHHSFEDKVPAVIFIQDFCFISDSVPYCRWVFPKAYSWYTSDHLGDITLGSQIFSAVTGMVRDESEMIKAVGERGSNLERMIVVREGRRRKNDWFNESVFERNKQWLSKEMLAKAMDDYYDARGWDRETGIPKREKLEELCLTYLADELEEKYGIGVPP
jgi:aldehyde:ferredoxin oxidoreductase